MGQADPAIETAQFFVHVFGGTDFVDAAFEHDLQTARFVWRARLAFRKGLEAPLDRFPTPR